MDDLNPYRKLLYYDLYKYIHNLESVEEITKVVEFINEQIREHQDYGKVIMIQNKFKGNSAPNFVAPGLLHYAIDYKSYVLIQYRTKFCIDEESINYDL